MMHNNISKERQYQIKDKDVLHKEVSVHNNP